MPFDKHMVDNATVLKDNPSLQSDKKLQSSIDKLGEKKDLSILAKSSGGILLCKNLSNNITSALMNIMSSYKTATREDLVGQIASLEAQYNLLEQLSGAEDDVVKSEKTISDYIMKKTS